MTKVGESPTRPTKSASPASTHYDASYFEWQADSGRFGAWANVDKYKSSIRESDRVLDFGCGGGFLLANLICKERFGIEPNPSARQQASKNGIIVFANPDEAINDLGQEAIDVIISDNALEHALEPWRELSGILPLLKAGGILHIVVPCEGVGWQYDANDVNQHVFSWSPQSLGNLLNAAGFEVVYARPLIHKWPPRGIRRPLMRLGRPAFNFACRVWGHIDRRWFQVEALARRPAK